MCGINGIVDFAGKEVISDQIESMNKRISYRGPDNQGCFIDNNIGIGHVRLSIIDLSSNGNQPMIYDKNGRKVIITYNGEVYNFKDLRRELEERGHRFVSNTDTEVLLASYVEYGFNCVKRFNGMFAFVIYDVNKQLLFGARDRFGQKPLKYCLDDNRFVFSSELKAILETGVKRSLDYDAINDFLTLQYVPSPGTGFKNIYKLPHSHYFVLDIKSKEFKIERYYDLDYTRKQSLSKKDWIDLIEKELEKAVKKRLVADVPLGAFLSGGVDSSAIVAFMSKYTDDIKTFSISFDQKDFDESEYARKVAALYKTNHTEFRVKSNDLLKYIDDIVYQFEEPFADTSQLPTLILSKLTKEHVKVALSGDAGDENFGGYDKHRIHVAINRYKPLFRLLKFFKFFANSKTGILLSTLDKDVSKRHYNFTNYFDELGKHEFYNDDFKRQLTSKENVFEKILNNKRFNEIDKVFYLDFNSYVPDDINVKVDMASMWNSLEVRSPMLDYELVDLMAQMPSKFKINLLQGKIIFKKMLEKYLPGNILYRKKKGFSVPIKYWFRGELKDYMKNTILNSDGLVLRIMRKEKITKLINNHLAGKDNSKKLWTLMVLNIWYKKYFCNV